VTKLFFLREVVVKVGLVQSMIQCPKCGKNISEDFSYCPYCGHEVPKIRSSDIRIIRIEGENIIKLSDIQVIEGGEGIYFLMKNVCNFPIRIENISVHKILPKPEEKKIFFGLLILRKEMEFMGGQSGLIFDRREEMLPGEERPIRIYTLYRKGRKSDATAFRYPVGSIRYSGKIIRRGFKYMIKIDGEIVVGEVTGPAHPMTAGAEVTREFSAKYIFEYLKW